MNKKGLSSIILGIYLLIILVIMGGVMYGTIYMTGSFVSRQLDSFQNDYYLERGIYYAIDYMRRTTGATFPYTEDWPASPASETSHIEITATEITTPPVHTQYTITSSTPTGAPSTRPEKTITAIYDRGKILSYIVSSAQ